MGKQEEGRLAYLPVREIAQDLLAEYNDSAKPEKTRINEIKHFLPRYLDLIARFEFPSHSAELSFSRLTPFDRSEWTTEELELLNQFQGTFFLHCLETYLISSFDHIDSILIMFRRAGFSIEEKLHLWETKIERESLLHFRDLVLHCFEKYDPTRMKNSFADKDLTVLIRTWINSKKVKEIFLQAIEKAIVQNDAQEEKEPNELSWVYELLKA